MKVKLAILGASYLQLPLVFKAKQMGIETHCFAWDNELAICKDVADYFYDISVLEKEKILDECIKIGINGITTIATDICIPTISFVAESMGLVCNSYKSSIYSTNKALMRSKFAEYDVPSPKYIKYSQNSSLELNDINYPLIVKPTDRSGSLGVTKVFNNDELNSALSLASTNSFEGAAIIEEYIDGYEVSVEHISWKGKHYFLTVTDKVTTGPPHFVELAHHQPSLCSQTVIQLLINVTEKALDSLDIKFGASHTELKICPDGSVKVIEVGARMGGDFIGSHLVPLSTGYDFLKGVILCAINQFEIPKISSLGSSGVYFLCSDTIDILKFFHLSNQFDVEKKILKEEMVYVKNSNDRSGYLIYKSDDRVNLF